MGVRVGGVGGVQRSAIWSAGCVCVCVLLWECVSVSVGVFVHVRVCAHACMS